MIELQWSNISFILAQESLLEVSVSTLRLGINMFQWEWKFMAVKTVYKFFLFLYHFLFMLPEKTDDLSRRFQRFPRKMTSEKRAQKFYTDDTSLLRSGHCFWLVALLVKFASTNQKGSVKSPSRNKCGVKIKGLTSLDYSANNLNWKWKLWS